MVSIQLDSDRLTYLPAISTLRIACGIENPSNTGTACVTPSPESNTIPVVRPDAYLPIISKVQFHTFLFKRPTVIVLLARLDAALGH